MDAVIPDATARSALVSPSDFTVSTRPLAYRGRRRRTHEHGVQVGERGGRSLDRLFVLIKRWPDAGNLRHFEDAGGLTDLNYRISTSGGEYLLKRFGNGNARAVTSHHSVVERLQLLGVPASRPVRTDSGACHVVSRGHLYALYPWVNGSHLSGTELGLEQCAAVGRALAHVHSALDRSLPPIQQTIYHISPSASASSHRLQSMRRRALSTQPAGDFDRQAVAYADSALRLLALHEAAQPSDLAVQTTTYVHGDFHPQNVLWRQGKIRCIIDWDRVSVRPRSWELVRAMTLWFAADDGALDLQRVGAFIRGYSAICRLDAEDLQEATKRLWWDRLTSSWMLERHYVDQDSSADHLVPQAQALLEWWSDHRDNVLDTLIAAADSQTAQRSP